MKLRKESPPGGPTGDWNGSSVGGAQPPASGVPLINLDLPWNPTRLEQRKGRIQRIGQLRSEVLIYNMRYRGSVVDRVHQLLSERQANIRNLFGQIADTLENVWVAAALRDEEEAKRVIAAVPKRHSFEMGYDRVGNVDWESCSRVPDSASQLEALRKGW